MDLSKVTEAAFLCDGAREVLPAPPGTFEMSREPIALLPRRPKATLDRSYEVHEVVGQPGDVVLTHGNDVVGFYVGDVLAVHPAHRGLGLGATLVLAAAPHRPLPTKRLVSQEGERALRKAWRIANGRESPHWVAGG